MKTNLLGMLLLASSMSLHAAPVVTDAGVFGEGSNARIGIDLASSGTTLADVDYEKNNFPVRGLNIGIQLTEDADVYSAPERALRWDVQHSQLLTDGLGFSNGNEFSATLRRSFAIDKLSVTPALGINWQDSNLVDFYHGVNASQSTQNKDQFSGVSTNASITASFPITKSLVGVGAVRSDFFGDSIAGSPIVGRNSVTEATLGVVFSF